MFGEQEDRHEERSAISGFQGRVAMDWTGSTVRVRC